MLVQRGEHLDEGRRRGVVPLIALLLLILSWDPVALNCAGGPEMIDHYSVTSLAALIVGWTEPNADDPAPEPIYGFGPGPVVPDVPAGPAPSVVLPAVSPPVGGVFYFTPIAIDRAGNRSDQPCS